MEDIMKKVIDESPITDEEAKEMILNKYNKTLEHWANKAFARKYRADKKKERTRRRKKLFPKQRG